MIDYTPYHEYKEIEDYIPDEKDVVRSKIVGFVLLLLYIAVFVWWFYKILHSSASILSIIQDCILVSVIALITGIVFVIIYALVSPGRQRLKADYAKVIGSVIGYDLGDDFKLLRTGSHDYDEFLYIFSEASFEPLRNHLEAIPDEGEQNIEEGRVIRHSFKGMKGEGFYLCDRRMKNGCGNTESIEVDYKERTLKHEFVIY